MHEMASPRALESGKRVSLYCALRVRGSTILPMKPPRVCQILTLVLALAPRHDASGQIQPVPPTKSFEGCYDLTMGRWWPWSFGVDNQFVTPPGRIRLLSERGKDGWEKDSFLIRALPPRKGAAVGRGGPAYWNVRTENE